MSNTLVPVVAGTVLKEERKYLLVQEKLPKAYGLWNIPAGHVEDELSIEETAIKETKEESGFNVKLIKEIAIFHEGIPRPVVHIYSADIIGGEITVNKEEILDVKWFTYDEIINMKDKFRFEYIFNLLVDLESKK